MNEKTSSQCGVKTPIVERMRKPTLVDFVLIIVSIQIVVNNNCPDVLPEEMKRIQVLQRVQQTGRKNRNRVDKSKWYFNKLTT